MSDSKHDLNSQPVRIGHGYDVHRFSEDGDHFVLGGVRISHDRGLEAHSDGDVLIHAICDALLGSIAAGDIGRHFPDTDAQYENIDSCVLLQKVYQQVKQAGYQLANVDVSVIAQAPVLSPYIQSMCDRLSQVMGVSQGQINIKATTTEKLGYIGREEGIAAHAVVLICHNHKK
jgi:2-C-methyl-D-erythritol 2,4-cyclodiphosphate synthase